MISVGFVVTAGETGVDLQTFSDPPELAQRMISFSRRGPLALVLLGRIYYRPARDFESDAELAAMLYEEGGLAALERLEGDFVVVGFDAFARRVIALRSPVGNYPLFWTQSPTAFAISTSIRPLVEPLAGGDFDEEYIADYLAYPTASLMEVPAEHTAYRNVQRVLPGWSLDVNLATGHVARHVAWDWAAHVDPAPASIEEAGALLRERLEGAVRERLGRNGTTASHLSGGMDSTAIALLGERLLAQRGEQVAALTHVYSGDPILAQERPYIEHALRGRFALRHHALDSDDLLRWDRAESTPPLDEPATGVAFYHRVSALTDVAHRVGADTILVGDGADHLVAQPRSIVAAELIREGHILRAVRVLREHAVATTGSTWNELKRALGWFVPRSHSPSALDVSPWFTREYATRQRLAERMRQWNIASVTGRRFSAADMAAISGDWFNWNIGAPRGILITRPFFDTRVVSLALGLPLRFHEPAWPKKPVLAAAMRGILPNEILERRRKAHFGALITGYARNRAWLDDLVATAPVDGMIDRRALFDAVERTALGLYGDAMTLGRLDLTLTFLQWLAGRRAWKEQTPRYPNDFSRIVTSSSAPRPSWSSRGS